MSPQNVRGRPLPYTFVMQVGKEGEQITVTSQPSDMIFIRNCKQCKFSVHTKAAKCIIGRFL